MEQKIGEGRDLQQLAFVPRAYVRVNDHSAHDGGETLELFNPKVPGLFHEQWIVWNQRPLRPGPGGRRLKLWNKFWNNLRKTEHNSVL